MTQLTEVELARKNTLKVVRTAIRLRHSIEADIELNRRLYEAEAAFDAAVARGELPGPLTVLRALGEEEASV